MSRLLPLRRTQSIHCGLKAALSIVNETAYETTFAFAPGEPGVIGRFQDALSHKTTLAFTAHGNNLVVEAPYMELSQLGLGLDPAQVSTRSIRDGFYICPRLYNYPGASPAGILWMLQSVKARVRRSKATVLICNGLDVIGNRNQLHATTDALH